MSKNNRTSNTTGSDMIEIKNYPASLILPAGAVSQSIMRNGRTIERRQNIILGDPEQIRNVSILQDDNSYAQMPMLNRTILSAITANRQEYLRSISV